MFSSATAAAMRTLASLSKTNDKEAIKAILRNNSKFGIDTMYSLYQKDEILFDIMSNESAEYALLAIGALGVNVPKDPSVVVERLEAKLYDANPKIRLALIRAIVKIADRGDTDIKTKNDILSILNKSKSIEKNQEVISEIENSIKIMESRP